MIAVGIDIGSVATKGVMVSGDTLWRTIVPTGWSPRMPGKV